jgi:hypothetical protein
VFIILRNNELFFYHIFFSDRRWINDVPLVYFNVKGIAFVLKYQYELINHKISQAEGEHFYGCRINMLTTPL